ncbi:hypothetical protein FACS1894190_10880 [Spirochaetia bacterium]|nr:hypothetical protein FACS1894190_10880 [Spirochaetia bacterium]GHV22399.1 hypothetical protein FACS189494_09190 [Spirochaetia bacterium]
MDMEIRCSLSAFKHSVTEVDIRWAFDTARYDEILDNGKYLLIGFDRNANLLEILYNVIDADTINVFHAMKCRNIFLPLLPDKE